MIQYLLDTNAWINLRETPARISENVREVLTAETQFAISPMSFVEIAQKTSKGKLILMEPLETWITRSMGSILTLLPITPEIALEAYRLPDFHDDPADRIITATARLHGLILVTSDKKLITHPSIRTLATR